MEEVIRKAASVIAVREGADAPEVLVLERSAASRFLPGYVVFPGGAADDEDAELAVRWFGSPDESARACAVRELAEEAGLLLTRDGIVDGGEIVDGWWISPRALLREWEAGARRLYWPTWFTVQALARAKTPTDLLEIRLRTREPDDGEIERLPRSVFWQD
jgi:8-oxo-dGTP pyrophosphatase MutT (NUDIX family)